jgi:NitT/TauT family transport system substrate-binding protein
MRYLRTMGLVLVLVLLAASCSQEAPVQEAMLARIRLPMGYIPDPQYAPLYVADHKGYLAAEGLDVEFDYASETDGIALVGAGELPFSLASGEQIIMARAEGLPVVYVMQWYQDYPIAVIAKATSGIQKPSDLVGRTVGIPGLYGASYVGFEGLLGATGLNDRDLELVEIGFTQTEALAQDRVEAAVVYSNNEPVRLASLGESLNVITVADYVGLVGNGLITNEKSIAENPEMVEAMVRAILKGLRDVLEDPDEAFEISKNYIEDLGATAEAEATERAVLEASLQMWMAPRLGITNAEAWDATQQVLLTIDFIQEPIDLGAAWTNRFVESAGIQ